MKSLFIISLLAISFACSNRSKDINAEYEYVYDEGYENDYYSQPDSFNDSLYESIGVSGIPEENSDTEDTAQYQIDGDENEPPDTSASLPGNSDNDSGNNSISRPDTLNARGSDTLNAPANDSAAIRFVPQEAIKNDDRDSGSYHSSSETENNFLTTGFNLITVIILVLLVLIVIQLFVLRKKISNTYENTKVLKNIAKSQRITRNIDIIENRLNRIETNVGQIIKNQTKPLDIIQPGSSDENTDEDNENKLSGKEPLEEVIKENNSPVEFFMPSPDNEGNFDNRKKSDHFIPSESIYKFIMNDNSDNTAIFYIHQDQNNMERAINYYSSILEKVCKSDNAFNPLGKAVKTLKPGQAVLIDNKWVVKEKALVRYD